MFGSILAHVHRRVANCSLAFGLAGCAYVGSNLGHTLEMPESTGMATRGILHHGARLPNQGLGYVRGRPTDTTYGGTARLVAAIERAAHQVEESFPHTVTLRVGDVAHPEGGAHPRHHSHRTGRDVDIMFYVINAQGESIHPEETHAFSRYGVAFEQGHPIHFDEARNWTLVRTMLMDPDIDVQWLFVSRGIKSLLLDYAIAHETDPDVLVRASYVLAQPENAQPHDDHLHVRIYCSEEERLGACIDTGYRWPWLRPRIETSGASGAHMDDAELLETLRRD